MHFLYEYNMCSCVLYDAIRHNTAPPGVKNKQIAVIVALGTQTMDCMERYVSALYLPSYRQLAPTETWSIFHIITASRRYSEPTVSSNFVSHPFCSALKTQWLLLLQDHAWTPWLDPITAYVGSSFPVVQETHLFCFFSFQACKCGRHNRGALLEQLPYIFSQLKIASRFI